MPCFCSRLTVPKEKLNACHVFDPPHCKSQRWNEGVSLDDISPLFIPYAAMWMLNLVLSLLEHGPILHIRQIIYISDKNLISCYIYNT